nr:hypothetical protein [Pseudomonas viridiflava]
MTLFQRFKSRASLNSGTQTDIAGDPLLSEPSAVELEQPEDDLVEDLKASDQNDVDAALERYLKRLKAAILNSFTKCAMPWRTRCKTVSKLPWRGQQRRVRVVVYRRVVGDAAFRGQTPDLTRRKAFEPFGIRLPLRKRGEGSKTAKPVLKA